MEMISKPMQCDVRIRDARSPDADMICTKDPTSSVHCLNEERECALVKGQGKAMHNVILLSWLQCDAKMWNLRLLWKHVVMHDHDAKALVFACERD